MEDQKQSVVAIFINGKDYEILVGSISDEDRKSMRTIVFKNLEHAANSATDSPINVSDLHNDILRSIRELGQILPGRIVYPTNITNDTN